MPPKTTHNEEVDGTAANKKRRVGVDEPSQITHSESASSDGGSLSSTPSIDGKRRKERQTDIIESNDSDWANDGIKYVVVTGGVLSGLGKGIMTSSIGAILRADGYRVTAIKIDPYINTDAGTMSPFEHGEVFVLDDGGEADLDLGNYERLMDLALGKDNNITTGKIYQLVIEKERRGDYLGKTVQVIPHVTEEIMKWIRRVAHKPVGNTSDYSKKPEEENQEKPEICVIELGGTVGDIESMPFIESLRQFQFKVGKPNFCLVHVSLVPVVGGSQKTKPTQHTVKELRALGLSPDIIACRCDVPLEESVRQKIALHCHVSPERVLSVHTVSNLFRVPALIESQGILKFLKRKFKIEPSSPNNNNSTVIRPSHDLSVWEDLANIEESCKNELNIALVGKYTDFEDAYLSVVKALQYAAICARRKLKISWIEATDLENLSSEDKDNEALKLKHSEAWRALKSADGILVPGGFGDRGIEGKILAAGWARISKTPYLGVCLGFQVAVIEYARSILGWTDANSEEFNATTPHKVLIYMPEISKTHMGGTMRLGSRKVILNPDSFTCAFYGGDTVIYERHRHRYEVNPEFVPQLEEKGLRFVGRDDTGQRMEVLELPTEVHPFFLGCQYHPEFKARPKRPSPPFESFIYAAAGMFEDMYAAKLAEQKNKAPSSSSSVAASVFNATAATTAAPAAAAATPAAPAVIKADLN